MAKKAAKSSRKRATPGTKKTALRTFWDMTTAELAAATQAFDEDFAFEASRPLTAAERRQHARARRRGRAGQEK